MEEDDKMNCEHVGWVVVRYPTNRNALKFCKKCVDGCKDKDLWTFVLQRNEKIAKDNRKKKVVISTRQANKVFENAKLHFLVQMYKQEVVK